MILLRFPTRAHMQAFMSREILLAKHNHPTTASYVDYADYTEKDSHHENHVDSECPKIEDATPRNGLCDKLSGTHCRHV